MPFRYIQKSRVGKSLINNGEKIRLPGFQGLNIYEVSVFFFKGLTESEVQSRARSIAFSFFLALFPAIIFLFTLIPYVPIAGFQEQLLRLIQKLMPPNTYEASRVTIEDIITHQRSGLLSFGFLFTLYVSSNGIKSLINAFNQSTKSKSVNSVFKQRITAIGLTFLMAILIILTIGLLLLSELATNYLVNKIDLTSKTPIYVLQVSKWILLIALCFTAISSLYYFGTSKKTRWRFISAGSTLATFLILLTSIAFNYFIANFAQYNKLYGSIGTLIIILLWIYFNCLQLIVGYELNLSIGNAKKKEARIF